MRSISKRLLPLTSSITLPVIETHRVFSFGGRMVKTKDCGIRIGDTIKVKIDRPIGTVHPKHDDIIYPINYGYVEGIIAQDGEEQDVYVLGEKERLEEFEGVLIAIIHRYDDVEEKWVAARKGAVYSKEEILKQTHFQEQFYHIDIRM